MIEAIVKNAEHMAYRLGIPMPQLDTDQPCMLLESEVRDWFEGYGYTEEGQEIVRQLEIASIRSV